MRQRATHFSPHVKQELLSGVLSERGNINIGSLSDQSGHPRETGQPPAWRPCVLRQRVVALILHSPARRHVHSHYNVRRG